MSQTHTVCIPCTECRFSWSISRDSLLNLAKLQMYKQRRPCGTLYPIKQLTEFDLPFQISISSELKRVTNNNCMDKKYILLCFAEERKSRSVNNEKFHFGVKSL